MFIIRAFLALSAFWFFSTVSVKKSTQSLYHPAQGSNHTGHGQLCDYVVLLLLAAVISLCSRPLPSYKSILSPVRQT